MITYEPVRWISYLMSALFPLLAARTLMVAKATRSLWLCAAGLASVLMFISLLLRGAMSRDQDDAFRMYETESALHLSAGYVLVGVLLKFTAEWVDDAAVQGTLSIFLTHMAAGYSVAAAICTCVGIPLMFDTTETQRISGYKLVSAALIVSIGLGVLAAVLALYHIKGGAASRRGSGQLPVVIVPAFVLVLWMCFELARVSLPMDNVANRSDAIFYCLSVLPAVGAIGVWSGSAEEFLGADAVGAAATAGCINRENSDVAAVEYDMQGVTRVSTPYGPKGRVASAAIDNGGLNAVVVGVQYCKQCQGGGTGTTTVSVAAAGLCSKCSYEAMLRQAMHRYA
ncbi:hypothetical protein GGI15_002751 [Coemansia interrupta]|uniref:Uncharacterized protein n=1 Tax=Coemansia interrupta TaxID=1126814 RepID=A0A9W8HGE8_9FUNG|nr:hypothetical protein GGI15_002751 [Coemansia interrupta]